MLLLAICICICKPRGEVDDHRSYVLRLLTLAMIVKMHSKARTQAFSTDLQYRNREGEEEREEER